MAFGSGLLQVSTTIAVVAILSYIFLKQDSNIAIFNGFLVSLSSTAIVMKLLQDRAEINTPHGRMSVGMLIFQDLCVIPFMLLIPILAGNGGSVIAVAFIMLKASVVIAAVIFAARWVVPHILHQVVSSRSRELFVITIILLCISTALLTSQFGLSLALGAFLAGIIISESEYASQAISDILPFKESFSGLFFISVGMLMNVDFFRANLATVASIVCVILILKFTTGILSASFFKQPFRVSIQTGIYLFQIGEFSFVLAVAGRASGLLTEYAYQIFLSSSVITMILTPFIISAAPSISAWLSSRAPLKRLERIKSREGEAHHLRRTGHVIIIGFGVNGSNLAKVLKESDIPYVILEMNAATVKRMKKKGEPIYYGDGTSSEILHKMGIHYAKVLVIAISDAAGTRRIVQIARHENPDLHIIVRTKYIAEVDDLTKLGANEVIPEEFETSIEIFSRTLHHYHTPRNVITGHIDNIRKDSYSVLRTVELPKKHLAERHEFLKDIETETYLIKDGSAIEGHTIKELSLRAETGVTIIAVQRKEKVNHNPPSDFVLKAGDVILFIGRREDVNRAIEYLESGNFI
jgi:CPA2 family monovalent cation:H+ antiporter-2